MRKFQWHSTPAVQLSSINIDLDLWRPSPTLTSVTGDLLILDDRHKIQLFDLERQYVMGLTLEQAKKFQTVQDLLLDIPTTEGLKIPLYLPVERQYIVSYFTNPEQVITNLSQFEAHLKYLQIVNYLNDDQDLVNLSRRIAVYLQSDAVRSMLHHEPKIANDWLSYFDRYVPELTHLIVDQLPLSAFELLYLDDGRYLRDMQLGLKFDFKSIGKELSGYYLEYYWLPEFKRLIAKNIRVNVINDILKEIVNNPNITNHLIDQLIQLDTQQQYDGMISLMLKTTNTNLNDKLNWQVVLDHKDYWHADYWLNLLYVADPDWVFDHLPFLNEMGHQSSDVIDILSNNRHLRPAHVSQHLNLNWDWEALTINRGMTHDFILKTLGQPGYHWVINKLLFNPNVRPQDVDLDQIRLDQIKYSFDSNPNWTWTLFKQCYQQYPSWQYEFDNFYVIRNITRLKWVYDDDILDILQFFNVTDDPLFWTNGVAYNPNLSEQFISQHLERFIGQYGDQIDSNIFRHPHFTPILLQQFYQRPYVLGTTSHSHYFYQQLAINPNFGASYVLMLKLMYVRYQQGKAWDLHVTPFQTLQQYFDFFIDYHKAA